ncbi:hypothetical protein FIBSPDRAFT_863287 [Athelia psychrophila]|uniref:Uncharacterized protein n=1 Tax=Athelia psychrophila TaxID=1759441 RepID=A0A166HJL3_9AGAM|nr:hypothetical protein FIBSPDRAFT_879983 [Fibularhizoctonia sp. CBS 109695]KZP18929.1 hypothetical protein FIBSPDRAFT_863287 [Fibularhizoctonia sp. CBS 109695]
MSAYLFLHGNSCRCDGGCAFKPLKVRLGLPNNPATRYTSFLTSTIPHIQHLQLSITDTSYTFISRLISLSPTMPRTRAAPPPLQFILRPVCAGLGCCYICPRLESRHDCLAPKAEALDQ